MSTKKWQVQLVLKINEERSGDGAALLDAMLWCLGKHPKFKFRRRLHSSLGYDLKREFWALDWDLDKINVEAPEYTVSTQSITFNFIMEADTYPRGIVDILLANGFTVTGQIGQFQYKQEGSVWPTFFVNE
jgi:hypothetical protein